MMSGNDCTWNKNIFSYVAGRKSQTVQTAYHLAEFSKMEVATRNERRSAVDRPYGGMCSCSVSDDRRRQRPRMLDTGASGSDTVCHTVQHSAFHERQFKVDPFWQTQPVQYSYGECVRRGRSDEVGIPSELRRWLGNILPVPAQFFHELLTCVCVSDK